MLPGEGWRAIKPSTMTYAVVGMLLCQAGVINAQENPAVAVGTRVRIAAATVGPDRLVATLVAFDEKTMTLAVKNQRTPLEVTRESITRLEVSRGRKGNAVKGALIGVIPWAIMVGLVVNSGGLAESGIFEPQSFAILGVTVGTGAVIGGAIKTERWQDIPISRVGLGMNQLEDRRVACSVSFAF